jgi:PIN domain nuclease of toxin-antitoxin system
MILDACALLWLTGGDHGKLSEGTLSRINAATTVSIIAITGFEIGIKHACGKLIKYCD